MPGGCLSESEAVVAEALAFARERIAQGPVLIASSAEPEAVRALQSRHGSEAAGHAVEAALSAIAEGLVAAGVRRLVIAGGETSGACVDRLGLRAFLVGPEIAAGVPCCAAPAARSRCCSPSSRGISAAPTSSPAPST